MSEPRCARCGADDPMVTTTMVYSALNRRDLICLACKDGERDHPDYKKVEAGRARKQAENLRSKGDIEGYESFQRLARKIESGEWRF